MTRDLENIESGVRYLAGAYGFRLPFVNGELRRQFEFIGAEIEAVRFDILLSSFSEPLISYTFLTGQFTGFVSLIVPVREQMAPTPALTGSSPGIPSLGLLAHSSPRSTRSTRTSLPTWIFPERPHPIVS